MRPLLPRLVEMGIDILNPIQWRCGAGIWQRSRRDPAADCASTVRLTISKRSLLERPRPCAAEVGSLIQTLASDHTGLILGPCRGLQAIAPIETSFAMYQAARQSGSF